jgi:hypothetical protein
MTRSYIIGLGASAAGSILTLMVKSSITKYPGLGDFLLFSAVPGSGIGVLYVAKTLLAMLLFTVFFPLFRDARIRFCVALAITVLILVVMSLGEAVIA